MRVTRINGSVISLFKDYINAGIITASNFNVNVELFRGSPIMISIVKAGNPAAEVPTEVGAGDFIGEQIDAADKHEGTN